MSAISRAAAAIAIFVLHGSRAVEAKKDKEEEKNNDAKQAEGGEGGAIAGSTFDCATDNTPYRIFSTYDGDGPDAKVEKVTLVSWDWATGERKEVWSLKADNKIERVDGCGINPVDNKAYCIAGIPEKEVYVARVDGSGFAFVARVSLPLPGQTKFPNTGAFDASGTFWAADNTGIWKLEGADKLPAGAETMPEVPFVGRAFHGGDIVVLDNKVMSLAQVQRNKLDTFGRQTNTLEGHLRVTDVSNASSPSTERLPAIPTLKGDGYGLPRGGFNSAYSYSGSIFFATVYDTIKRPNLGSPTRGGVFQVFPDFTAGTFTYTKVAESFKEWNSDGLNCINTQSPVQALGPAQLPGSVPVPGPAPAPGPVPGPAPAPGPVQVPAQQNTVPSGDLKDDSARAVPTIVLLSMMAALVARG